MLKRLSSLSRATRAFLALALVAVTCGIGTPFALAAAAPKFEAPFACGYKQGGGTSSGAHKTPWEIDFWTPVGVPIHASAAGTVRIASFQRTGGYGKLVVIEHSGGWRTYYAHLDAINVKVNQKVTQGQRIGKSGATTAKYANMGPHLHFEVRANRSWPGGIRPAVFHGKKFPYPSGYITSQNCPKKATPTRPKATAKATPKTTARATPKTRTTATPKATATAATKAATPKKKTTATATPKTSPDAKSSTTNPTTTATPATPRATAIPTTATPTTATPTTATQTAEPTVEPTETQRPAAEPEADDLPDLSDTNPQIEEPNQPKEPVADASPRDADPVVDQETGLTQSGNKVPPADTAPASEVQPARDEQGGYGGKDSKGGLAKTGC
ncbi:hypothetical protein GCM10027418_23000 [Mariniluteicoccus endophyticus]